MATVYRIAKFDRVFVKADLRKTKGAWPWVAMPTEFNSHGYQTLAEDYPDELPALYGCWCALVAIAARCPEPGVLANSRGDGITPDRAARLAYMPVEPMRKLFAWASSERVGWLEVVSSSGESPDAIPTPSGDHREIIGRSSGLQDRTGQDTTGQDDVASATCSEPASPDSPQDDPVVMEFPTNGKGSKVWALRQSKVSEYLESFPGVDVDAELLKARQWCRDNASKRKTPQGMPGFLSRWLSKRQNAGEPISRGSPQKPPPRTVTDADLLAILTADDS